MRYAAEYPTTDIILNYLAHRCDQGATDNIVSKDLQAIKWIFRSKGKNFPCFNHPSIAICIRSIGRVNPAQQRNSYPITLPLLQRMLSTLPARDADTQLTRMIFAWFYSGANRSSEFLPKTQSDFAHAISVNHIKIYPASNNKPHYMIFTFWKSKTNQTKTKQQSTFPCLCRWSICAVRETEIYFRDFKKVKAHTALFEWKHSRRLVTYNDILTKLRACITQIGLDSSNYGTHSFRRGAALDALRLQIPEPVCAQIGHWKSLESMSPYMRLDPHSIVNIRQHHTDQLAQPQATRPVLDLNQLECAIPRAAQPISPAQSSTQSSKQPRQSRYPLRSSTSSVQPAKQSASKKSKQSSKSKKSKHRKHSTKHRTDRCPCGKQHSGNWICCDECNQWFHACCVHLSNQEVHNMKSHSWFCQRCLAN